MAIVTFDEFATVVGERMAEGLDEEQVTATIDLVQGEMEALLGRPLEITTFTDESYSINLVDGILVLRNTPVVALTEIKDDADNIVPAASYDVLSWGLDFSGYSSIVINDPVIWTPSSTHFAWQQTPDILLLATGGYPQAHWRITYDAGLDGANIPALRSLLIRAVRRELISLAEGPAAFYTTMKVEDYSWRKNERVQQAMVSAFTEGELRIIDRYARKQIS